MSPTEVVTRERWQQELDQIHIEEKRATRERPYLWWRRHDEYHAEIQEGATR
jgi:hypothetical protein